ncbi:phosphoribosylglycinamide formyltransferase [Bacillus sp. FJAT-47783]|uniref:phosphoribosylglycinamide formyltransferase n=1 Tax=Bacillus sp. FJAT-47783 TaxID=2922712 RepID=UPI001FAE3917|nr:phosphoribosylglycinamide formyltransferase [Bacillus sp. FJAT-47783]
MKRIAVFASGNGSNFQSIVDSIKDRKLEAEVSLLVCDKVGAKVVERAERENIPRFVFTPKEYESKAHFEQDIIEELRQNDIDFIFLAGYMRLIGPTLLKEYEGKIINIHPSLLPSFPGKNAIEQALEAGVKVTGVTIHYVDEGMDTGPIIAQKAVEIDAEDDAKSLAQKIHQIEHSFYPAVIHKLLNKTI